MVHETTKLKIDIQHAVANGIMKYSTPYETLMFADETFKNLESFRYYKYLKIYVKDNKMYFDIELDEDEINQLSKNDLKQIKNISDKIRYFEMAEQINQHLKTPEQKEIELQNTKNFIATVLEEEEKKEEDFVPARKNNIQRIKCIKFILEKMFNIPAEIEEQDLFLSISMVFKELTLNQDMLYLIILLSFYTDTVIIHPYYEDSEDFENDNVIGIRLFFGIYKGGEF